MSPRVFFSIVLPIAGVLAGLWSNSAIACSCISSKETQNGVRLYVRELYDNAENIVRVRVLKVTEVGDRHQQAELQIIESWKGRFSLGDVIRSDTSDTEGGMCDVSVGAGEEIFLVFDTEPVRINGCPGDLVLSKLERRYLNRLRPKRPKRRGEPVAREEVRVRAR